MRHFLILAIVTALAASPAMAADLGTPWYLSTAPAPESFDGFYANARALDDSVPAAGAVATAVGFTAGVLFIAEEAALVDTDFGMQNWVVILHGTNLCSGEIYLTLGYTYSGSPSRTTMASDVVSIADCGDVMVDYVLTPSTDFIVPAGAHLFFDYWTPSAAGNPGSLYVGAEESMIMQPPAAPAEPTPELATFGLVAVGLVAVVGVVYARRR